ncbi:hypothetical protein EDB83DRAFT_132124 [Lactarius deliciosus]|nr:hypothetical protein EDB83DRAFT_132124 [Lactarius deliciosus]
MRSPGTCLMRRGADIQRPWNSRAFSGPLSDARRACSCFGWFHICAPRLLLRAQPSTHQPIWDTDHPTFYTRPLNYTTSHSPGYLCATPLTDLNIGALTGTVARTVSYLFEVVRWRMQVGGLTEPGRRCGIWL